MAPGFLLPDRIVKFPLCFFLAGMAMKNVRCWKLIDRDALADIGRKADKKYSFSKAGISEGIIELAQIFIIL